MIAAERISYLQDQIARFDDQQAYKELFVSLYGYLYNFAWNFVKSKQLSEEVVSDVFIKVWEKRKSLGKIDNLKIYLYVSAKNIAINYLDKKAYRPFSSIEDHANELKSSYPDPEQLLITSDMMLIINKAIRQLPPKCRLIFKLVKEDRMKYKEVAEVLHISERTVENQVAIAVRKIGSSISFDINRAVSSTANHAK
ncbi:MAG: RNA polymerase sigma-70 factor [Bacteroidetes bacterium]|nr:RNA polymerase sigma-70 factor [Bacteroidota bacterium]MBS1972864.1 RNA polymerase sigma-70 factor [Bacteroidota bacterium]